jgi:hypothetical protein
MRPSAAQSRLLPAPAFRWTALFCALAVWGLGLLAVSPELHATLHHEADHADHDCAVTLFSHGVDAGTGLLPDLGAPGQTVAELIPVTPALPASDAHLRLPPACGPPVR